MAGKVVILSYTAHIRVCKGGYCRSPQTATCHIAKH